MARRPIGGRGRLPLFGRPTDAAIGLQRDRRLEISQHDHSLRGAAGAADGGRDLFADALPAFLRRHGLWRHDAPRNHNVGPDERRREREGDGQFRRQRRERPCLVFLSGRAAGHGGDRGTDDDLLHREKCLRQTGRGACGVQRDAVSGGAVFLQDPVLLLQRREARARRDGAHAGRVLSRQEHIGRQAGDGAPSRDAFLHVLS